MIVGRQRPYTKPQPTKTSPIPATENEPIESEKQTIRFAINRWEREMYIPFITIFETNNPDIHIEPVFIDDILRYNTSEPVPFEEAGRELVLASDVLHRFFNPQDVADRLFLDLRPFIAAEEDFDLADYNAELLSFYEIDGGLWTLPSEMFFECFFYNKEIFDAASQPYPQAGWTWTEFLATAQALTIREGNETIQLKPPLPTATNFPSTQFLCHPLNSHDPIIVLIFMETAVASTESHSPAHP